MSDPDASTIAGGAYVATTSTADDHAELYAAFQAIVAAGEGYPQSPDKPVTWLEFEDYWLGPATVSVVARSVADGSFAGAYEIKPNGFGRAAHVGNAGYFVVPEHRGHGLGEALVLHSFESGLAHGFDALQFNFVFETNPARHLYERLGFTTVGRVPDVIDGEAVYIYWRAL